MSWAGDLPVDELLKASRRPEVVEAMRVFYAEAAHRIAAEGPTCWNRGACCRFGEYGHRLYVTALEVAYYLARSQDVAAGGAGRSETGALRNAGDDTFIDASPPARWKLAVLVPEVVEDACPHAHGGQCHAREHRPLGCRIFYCDPAAQHWQGPLTEECLQELRVLHEELGVPYFYADWLAVLRALNA